MGLSRRNRIVLIAVATAAVTGTGIGTAFASASNHHWAAAHSRPGHGPHTSGRPGFAPGPRSSWPGRTTSTGPIASAWPTSPSAPVSAPPVNPSPTPRKPSPTPTPTHSTGGSGSTPSTPVAAVLAQINKLRAQNGLPAYTLSSGLNSSAHAHTEAMLANKCGLSHQCPGEASLGDRVTKAGVSWNTCGENIGEGGPIADNESAIASAAEGQTTMMYNEKAPNDGHRKNLLSTAFKHIGIDITRDASGTVWMTQDFSN